jgi:hypothetical protein
MRATQQTVNAPTQRRISRSAAAFILISFALLIALSATPAYADLVINKYTNDFAVNSPNNEQLKLCACEAKVDRIVIENTGNFFADFHVGIESNYPRAIQVPNPDFSLAPGRFQEILVYIDDSCQLAGTFGYTVVVTNSYGRTQRVNRTIRVDMCQTTALYVTPDNATTGLCKPATFGVNVSNVGTFPDSFTLDFGQFNANANLTQRSMRLDAGQSYTQNVSFTFACQDYGKRTVPFTVFTSRNGAGAMTWRDIDVINQFDYDINLPTSMQVCAKTTTRVPFTIKNAADAPDELIIQSSNPDYVTVPQDLRLGTRQELNATVALSPQNPGRYSFTVSARDIYGGVQKQRTVDLDVANCYNPAVEMRISPTETAAVPVQTCCGPKTFFVNVQNNGDREQAFEIILEGPSFFTLDETTVRLAPTQNVNVPLRATLPCSDSEYTVTATVYPAGHPDVRQSAQLVVDGQTQRTCHMVQIDQDELAIQGNPQSVPVVVRQTGSAPGNYTVVANSTIFRIAEQNISMSPGEQMEIHLVPTVDLNHLERGRYIVLPVFTLTTQDITYVESVGVTLEPRPWWEGFRDWLDMLGWQSAGLCTWLILLLALLIIVALVILIIIYSGTPLFPEGLQRRTLMRAKIVLLIAIALLILWLIFVQPPAPEQVYERTADGNATAIEWYQGTSKTIDLQPYFYDPDRDIISYSVSQPRDISATVAGSKLTLTPDDNFAGENTMTVTATDSKGLSTTSPPFTLRVIPRKDLSFVQLLQAYCQHIVIAELMLLVLLLFLITLSIREYRESPYSRNVLVVVDREEKRTRRAQRTRTARRSPRKERRTPRAPRRSTRTSRAARAATPRSRALAPIPARSPQVLQPARGRQAELAPAQHTVLREYKAGGQTVNIAVGTPAAAPAPVIVPGAKPAEVVYVGSKSGSTVHTPYCMVARRIPKNKRVAYNSKREAVTAGMVPCRVCRPFEGSI